MTDQDKMREAFEKWSTENGAFPDWIGKYKSGTYKNTTVSRQWDAWQAAWNAALKGD